MRYALLIAILVLVFVFDRGWSRSMIDVAPAVALEPSQAPTDPSLVRAPQSIQY